MEIKNYSKDGHTIIELEGSLDSNTVEQAQGKIMPLIVSKSCMILDLTKCNYVSSAGLRLLLMVAKQLTSQEGWLTLTCVCEEVKDVMEMTGFSGFFQAYPTVDEAIAALGKGKP